MSKYFEYIKSIVKDKTFKDNLEKADSIATMVSLGLKLCERAKEKAKTEDEKAFNLLIKFTFEAAQETISNSRNLSIRSIKGKDIKKNLYDIFVTAKDQTNDQYLNGYHLPSHTLIQEFKKQFRELLEVEGYRELVHDFISDFDIRIEKVDGEQDNTFFKQWSDNIRNKINLAKHLRLTSAMIYKINPVDKKYFAEYYIENNAVVADIHDTWNKEDKYFLEYVNKNSEDLGAINIVLKSINKRDKQGYHDKDNRYTVVAAPFGTGKTSLVVYIASTLASKYLDRESLINNNDCDNDDDNTAASASTDNSRNSSNISSFDYIPVFIALKDVDDESGSYIERKLQSIFTGQQQQAVKRSNILLILDGLDEYNFEETKLKQVLDNLSKDDNYPNIYFLITTRLEAGMKKLNLHLEEYIRLLPFNESQVNAFFTRYGMPQYSFDKIDSYGLGNEEKRKPLFCWMIVALNPNCERFLYQSANTTATITNSSKFSPHLTIALLYQDFIHSLMSAKYKDTTREFSEYYADVKNLLRKIAAIKQSCEYHGERMTVSQVIKRLKDYYGLDYSKDSKERKNILNLAPTSYFYLSGKETKDKALDFIHKSFKEHLLAEYYIETMLDCRNKHYLNVAVPSDQTINHLEGLLRMIKDEDEILKEQTSNFMSSLNISQRDGKTLKEILVENATKIIKSDLKTSKSNKKEDENKSGNDRIDIWISLYVLNILSPKNNINKEILPHLIKTSSNIVPSCLKRFVGIDLTGVNLDGANIAYINLSGANLSNSNLSGANLSGANLSGAILYHTKLIGANLSRANLSRAKLSYANLSCVRLYSANLFNAVLYRINLSGADLSFTNLIYAILDDANLSNANLSCTNISFAQLYDVNLSFADLFNANLSFALLHGAICPGVNLSGADLSGSNFSGAKIYNVNLSAAICPGANLSGANLSGSNLSGVDLSNANLSNANISAANLSNANLSAANLSDTKFSGANLSGGNLSYVNLNAADLSKANLSYANLSYAYLICANLSFAQLHGAICPGANLSDANLSGANLSGSNLLDANLDGANLSYVNLNTADLSKANLSYANLSYANLSYANLSYANLYNTKFYSAILYDTNFSGIFR